MQQINLIDLEFQYKILVQKIFDSEGRQYIKKECFNRNFFSRGVYLWIYNNGDIQRIIYVGTAIGIDGFYGRNKDHINNILKGDGTFYSFPPNRKDIYELFIYNQEDKGLATCSEDISKGKNIWIPKGKGAKKHLITNEDFDTKWRNLACDFLRNCALLGLAFDTNGKSKELIKEEAKKIESYIQYRIIDSFDSYIKKTGWRFKQYYNNNNRHSFWGKIEKDREEIVNVPKETDKIIDKYLFPI